MRRAIAACLAAAMTIHCVPAAGQDPMAYAAPFPDNLETRILPLLAMMQAAEGWDRALRDDPGLRALAAKRTKRWSENCTPLPGCLADPWAWTEEDISVAGTRLRLLMRDRRLVDTLVTAQMRPSHRFARHEGGSNADMVVAAWRDTAAAMNRMIAVYAKAEAPRYPKIDSMIFDIANPEFATVLSTHGVATVAQSRREDLFFDPARRYVLGLLRMNERTEAGTFRPLLASDNAPAAQALAQTDWKAAPYTALLVFGHGPEDAISRTGVMGHIRLGIAADLYARGVAPFIIVSGGNVHPNRTPYNEALEMKRILITDYGVPAHRILTEPHARHTTTNLRNCARLLLAAGFPADRQALIVSDHRTIQYIAGPGLAQRNLREMGVQPGRISPGPDRFTLRFLPDSTAFHVDAAADPLDP